MIVFAFDTETTGIPESMLLPLDQQPEIVEFAGILADLKTGEQLFAIDQLIKPSKPLPAIITKITGLTDEKLKDAPAFKEVSIQIQAAIESAPALLAHNLTFDRAMCDIEAQRCDFTIAWPKLCLDTVEQTVHYKGYRLTLTALYEFLFNEKFPEAHRAMNDVQALLKVAQRMFERGDL